MKVHELITYLQTLPPKAICLTYGGDGYCETLIKLSKPLECKVIKNPNQDELSKYALHKVRGKSAVLF